MWFPIGVQQHVRKANLKKSLFCCCCFFSIYVAPRNRFQECHLSFDALLWKASQCYGNFILSIFLLNVGAVYQRRWKRALSGIFCAPRDARGVGSPQQQTHHKEPDFIGSSLKYSCRRHARIWNEEYSVPRSESAEPLYPFLPGRGAAWPCFQTTLLLNVTLL